jgi:hypothetical protein
VKLFLLTLCLISLALDFSGDQAYGVDTEAEISAAKTSIKQFAVALQTELKAAMQAGGPVAAIGVCNQKAIPITEQVSTEQGIKLTRVSLKNRNPDNAPNEWQTSVLESFEVRKTAGSDVGSIAWSETVTVDGKQEFRFMKAIPTAAVCLACHGTNLAPEVSRTLAELYPQDRATGFSEGDIRGAFVATRNLSD